MPTTLASTRDLDLPSSRYAELIVRAIESAAAVRRRSHFFVWSQNHLHALLPHQLAICGAYQRSSKQLEFDVFYAAPLSAGLLSSLLDHQSVLMRRLVSQWVAGQGRCTVQTLIGAPEPGEQSCYVPLVAAGYSQLLAHGVTRPQRPAEVESIFMLASVGAQWTAQHCQFFDLMLPHLHASYLRVLANERELSVPKPVPVVARLPNPPSPITERERQILLWVREGMSNQEVGAQLAISALTVKNHVQKILRKLGAANRAQAVAMAISRNLMDAGEYKSNEKRPTS